MAGETINSERALAGGGELGQLIRDFPWAEHAPVMMWMTDQAGSTTHLNQSSLRSAANGHYIPARSQNALQLRAHIGVLRLLLRLPGMNGSAVAAAASELQPTRKVIFATGATGSDLDGVRNPNVLHKPYSEEDIVIALKRAQAQR